MESKKGNKIRKIGAILAFLILVIGLVVFLLNSKKETYVDGEIEKKEIEALVCTAQGMDEAFFKPENVNMVENIIKLTFLNNKLDKIHYSYKGIYRANDLAVSDETRLHAEYNEYMGENGRALGDLSPAYSIVGNRLQIDLVVDEIKKLDKITAKLFLINEQDVDNFSKQSLRKIRNYYEDKGFSCEKF